MKVLVVANTSWFIYNFQRAFINDLSGSGHEVVVVAPGDETTVLLDQRGIRSIAIPMERSGFNPFVEWGSVAALARVYGREHPDAVFQSTVKPVIYGSLAARRAGVRTVINMIPGLGYVFAGEGYRQRFLRPAVKLLYKLALRHSNRVFFQNQDDRRYFIEAGLVREEVTDLSWGLGVDLERFRPSSEVPARTDVFLLIARMLTEKGIGEFVASATELRKEFPDARFQLLGKIDPGNPGAVAGDTLRRWNDASLIEYLGEVADVRPILAEAGVVVLPSYYREGIPNALLEAMAMGKPIITTDTPGCRDTVIHGKTGLLIPPRDVGALTSAMRMLLTHPEIQEEMGRRGREFAKERFDVTVVNKKLIEALTDR